MSSESKKQKLAVTVYTPESPLSNPLKLIREIFCDIWRTRELIGMLFVRDLKAAYRQTYLGYIWILLPAIATTAVWYYMTNQKLIKVAETPIPYPAFVMIGQIIWGTFTAAFTAPQMGFTGGSPVFMKLKVPPEAFIANACAKIVFDLLVKTLLIATIVIIFWNDLTISWTILLVPVGFLITMLFGVSLGLFMVPIGSLYKDVERVVTMALPFLMYSTPVIFPLADGDGLAATLMKWNPLSPLIEVTRSWLTQGTADPGLLVGFFILIPISLLIGLVGLVILRVSMPHLVVRLGM
jgi:lipopolysaccharide transport system permease protein